MRWALYILLGILMLGMFDAAGRLIVLKGGASFEFVRSATSNSRVLFVYDPGILHDGVTSSLTQVPVWKEDGDVLLVSYTGKRFDGKAVARATGRELRYYVDYEGYDTVVFIGSSMGGLVSYDTYLFVADMPVEFKFILIDAPTKRSDFQAPLDKICLIGAAHFAGPISNLASKLYFNATFRAPAEENIEPGVDRDELAKRVEEAKSFPLSMHNDWIRYIIGHAPVAEDSLYGLDVVYMRSLRDTDTVRLEAFDAWDAAAGGSAKLVEVDSTHVGYYERPQTWNGAFRRATGLLNLDRS